MKWRMTPAELYISMREICEQYADIGDASSDGEQLMTRLKTCCFAMGEYINLTQGQIDVIYRHREEWSKIAMQTCVRPYEYFRSYGRNVAVDVQGNNPRVLKPEELYLWEVANPKPITGEFDTAKGMPDDGRELLLSAFERLSNEVGRRRIRRRLKK